MTKKLTGTLPYQTPLNADLGTLAYIDHKTVYFKVTTNTQTGSGGVAGVQTFIWNNVTYDNVGGYDSSTGRYTISEAGLYMFTYTMTPSSLSKSSRYFRAQLYRLRNGVNTVLYNPHQTISDELDNADYNSVSATVIEPTQVGDQFWITYGSSIDASNYTFYVDMSWFAGAKLI